MLVVLTETYFNKVNVQITQRDGFIQINTLFRRITVSFKTAFTLILFSISSN